MKRTHHTCLAVAICLLALPAPRAARAATHDLTGTWSYTTSGNWVTGVCPKGTDSAGTLQITQTGDTFTLKLLSGMVCSPASLCSYSGTIAGAVYTATNTAVVDTEGGKATNTVTFTASSATAASGSDASSYVHPGGMTCTWGFNISLSRSMPDGGSGQDSGGVIPADAAPDSSADTGADTNAVTPDAGSSADARPPDRTDDDDGCSLGGGGPTGLTLLALLLLPLWLRRRRHGGAWPRRRLISR